MKTQQTRQARMIGQKIENLLDEFELEGTTVERRVILTSEITQLSQAYRVLTGKFYVRKR